MVHRAKNICWVILLGFTAAFLTSLVVGPDVMKYCKSDLRWFPVVITALSVFGIIIASAAMLVLSIIEWICKMMQAPETVGRRKSICRGILIALVLMLFVVMGAGVTPARPSAIFKLTGANFLPAVLTFFALTGGSFILTVLLALQCVGWYSNYYWGKRDRYVVESACENFLIAFAYFEPKGSPRDGQKGGWHKGCMIFLNPDAEIPYWIKEEDDRERYIHQAVEANAVRLDPQLVFENPQQIGVWLSQESHRLGTS
jgi:hypothetical protein